MTGDDVRAWRTGHSYTYRQLATALGIEPSTLVRWETGARAVPAYLRLALCELEHRAGGCEHDGA